MNVMLIGYGAISREVLKHIGADEPARISAILVRPARLDETRLGIALHKGPEGPIPDGCFYTGTSHPRGLDSRYAEIGFVCRGQILGSGRAIRSWPKRGGGVLCRCRCWTGTRMCSTKGDRTPG